MAKANKQDLVRFRMAVPADDTEVLAWMASQPSVSTALCILVREAVRTYGTGDITKYLTLRKSGSEPASVAPARPNVQPNVATPRPAPQSNASTPAQTGGSQTQTMDDDALAKMFN